MSKKISIVKNGPYLVSGNVPLNQDIVEYNKEGIPLKTVKGKLYSEKESYALCRCGHSQNKPYCDGTHTKIGFDGTENPEAKTKYDSQAEIIDGPDLKLKDAQQFCSGAGFCHREGNVWNLTENSNNPRAKETAIEETMACPSGRLVACNKKTNETIEPKLEPSIGILEDGPLSVKGGIPVESTDGSIYEIRNRVTLCRCGKSSNKPFCDGSHLD
jgi:CDGSH-type Zn-finger protein